MPWEIDKGLGNTPCSNNKSVPCGCRAGGRHNAASGLEGSRFRAGGSSGSNVCLALVIMLMAFNHASI